MACVHIRFYEELNDHLRPDERKTTIRKVFAGTPSVKDVIESCGVPHVEVDLVVVDGESVGFGHRLAGGERIAVYPVFESIDITPVVRLRPEPLRTPRFVVDANLGRLARLLRLLGFDSVYDADLQDGDIARLADDELRIILTRDRGLLMRRLVSRGYYVRSDNPRTQLAEVVARFDLRGTVRLFSRCSDCNGRIHPVSKASISDRLPERTRSTYSDFFMCDSCGKLYWRGSHWPQLTRLVSEVLGR